MPCYAPLDAWQTAGGAIKFKISGDIYRTLKLPCGQCIGCRLERSRQWAVRCVHEAQCHEFSSFITLTYDDNFLPVDRSLHYSDFQLFMKRLRKSLGSERQRVRFFMAGEYGERTGRPHFHACIFGHYFPDRVLYRDMPSGARLYTSEALSRLWPFGFSSVGDVTFESAAYVARYVTKKITGDAAYEHYKVVDSETGEVFWRTPEFCRMSLKPGIGARWYEKYKAQVFPRDYVVIRGSKCKPPRYYEILCKASTPEVVDWVKIDRECEAMKHLFDNTPDRLQVRETIAKARLSFKLRGLE